METASLVPCHSVCQMPGSRLEIMSQIPKWSKITVLQVSTDLYQPKSGLLISNWIELLEFLASLTRTLICIWE